VYYVDDGCQSDLNAKRAILVPNSRQYKFGVRCCSMDGASCITIGSCPTDFKTRDIAINLCRQKGRRLCSKTMILRDVCCQTGGNCDSYYVWTSSYAYTSSLPPTPSPTDIPTAWPTPATSASPTDLRTLPQTPTPTDLPTLPPTPTPTDLPTAPPTHSYKSSSPPTPSPTDIPTAPQTRERVYYVDDGCQSDLNAKRAIHVPNSRQYKFGVRCCSEDGSSCITIGSCPTDVKTFDIAINLCKQKGRRVCSKAMLLSDVCCGAGGQCDAHYV